MMGFAVTILGLNLAILVIVILLLWAFAVRIQDVSFIDAFWGFGMVLMAFASWLHSGPPTLRGNILLGLTTLWGMRLAVHLFTRWRAEGEDARYKRIIGGAMETKGWSWRKTALIMVFGMQAPLLFITCLPAQIGIIYSNSNTDIGLLVWIGGLVALTGITFETVGDIQLKSFKANANNRGKVLGTGLWRYTRHPNYFGDFTAWWGIWLVAADTGFAVAAASVIGPLFLSFTLMRWSGGPLLERGMRKTRPGYAEYIARTSAFFPWPPKKV
jgi:steroid 5-alpha reductase family enzyme